MFVIFLDEFILDTVVNTAEISTDFDSPTTHTRRFIETEHGVSNITFGLHNIYIAIGTFAAAIFIVAMVVKTIHFFYFFFLLQYER